MARLATPVRAAALPPAISAVTAFRARSPVSPGVYIYKDRSMVRRHSWMVGGRSVEMSVGGDRMAPPEEAAAGSREEEREKGRDESKPGARATERQAVDFVIANTARETLGGDKSRWLTIDPTLSCVLPQHQHFSHGLDTDALLDADRIENAVGS